MKCKNVESVKLSQSRGGVLSRLKLLVGVVQIQCRVIGEARWG